MNNKNLLKNASKRGEQRFKFKPAAAMLVAAISFSGYGASADASLFSVDLHGAGDGLITRDTVTKLDWLDLTATLGLTPNAVLAGAGGWVSQGFRYATSGEWHTLATVGFGVTRYQGSWGGNGQWTQGVAAIAMLGNTCPTGCVGSHPGEGFSRGLLYQADTDGTSYALGIYGAGYVYGTTPDGIFYNSGSDFGVNTANATYGNFLVRASDWVPLVVAPVPLPPALWLLGSGLLGLIGVARRKAA